MAEQEKKQTLFISYCQKDGTSYADDLEEELTNYFDVYRDKTKLKANDDIYDFMAKISNCDNVVIVLTEKYLYSANCMYELTSLTQLKEWGVKSCIITIFSDFYETENRSKVINYWFKEKEKLEKQYINNKHAKLSVGQELEKVNQICESIDRDLYNISRRLNPSQIKAVSTIIKQARINRTRRDNIVNRGENEVERMLIKYGSLSMKEISEKANMSMSSVNQLLRRMGDKNLLDIQQEMYDNGTIKRKINKYSLKGD